MTVTSQASPAKTAKARRTSAFRWVPAAAGWTVGVIATLSLLASVSPLVRSLIKVPREFVNDYIFNFPDTSFAWAFVLALLAAARDALRPGGLLVAETPDPTNLVMGACNFHLDPTHRAPVPPAQLEFLVSAGGFVDVETWRLHPKEDVDLSGLRLPGIDATASALVADALQRGLFGTQDHAVLARAPALDPVAADLGRPPR